MTDDYIDCWFGDPAYSFYNLAAYSSISCAFDYDILYNTRYGRASGTNNDLAAGLLGTLNAPTMTGTWSISFTSDTNFTVSGPGGVSTNLNIPESCVEVWDADANVGGPVAYAYFGDDSFTEANQGLMWLSSISISGGLHGDAITTPSFLPWIRPRGARPIIPPW